MSGYEINLEGLVKNIVKSLECPKCGKRTMELVLSNDLGSLKCYKCGYQEVKKEV